MLEESKLKKLAVKVTRFRKIQRDRALLANLEAQEADVYLKTTEKLARKIHSGYFQKKKDINPFNKLMVHKKLLRGKIPLDKKIDILYDVIIEKELVAEVAKRYRRNVGTVNILVNKVKKNKEMLTNLVEKRIDNRTLGQ
jgi:hypothetical protein